MWTCRFILVIASILLLSGCAYAPGQYMEQEPSRPSKLASLLGTTSQPDEQDPPPPNAVIAITPELLAQQKRAALADAGPRLDPFTRPSKTYTIGPADVLNVVVWDHPELALAPAGAASTAGGEAMGQSTVGNGYNVSLDGFIQIPYAGNIRVVGLTESEARDLITGRLSKYLKQPQVTVRIQSYRSGRIYVDGEVRTPGLLALNDVPMTLPEALARAGGLTPDGDRASIAITHDGQTTLVNLTRLAQTGTNPSSLLLSPGDMVYVLSRVDSPVYVLGEVSRQMTLYLRHGRLTLSQALGEAGGVNPGTGNPGQIYVIRPTQAEKPEIFHLDAKTPSTYALAAGFQLKANDVVFVDPVPLVRWNRVISLILPSAQAASTTAYTATLKP